MISLGSLLLPLGHVGFVFSIFNVLYHKRKEKYFKTFLYIFFKNTVKTYFCFPVKRLIFYFRYILV